MPKRDSGADSSEAKLDFARKKSLLQNVIDSARKIGQNGINKKSDTFDQRSFWKKKIHHILSGDASAVQLIHRNRDPVN